MNEQSRYPIEKDNYARIITSHRFSEIENEIAKVISHIDNDDHVIIKLIKDNRKFWFPVQRLEKISELEGKVEETI